MSEPVISYVPVDDINPAHRNDVELVLSELSRSPSDDEASGVYLLHVEVLSDETLSVLARFCDQHQDGTFVLISPHNDQSRLVSAYELGIQEHILLPVNPRLLHIKLEKVIRARDIQRAQTQKNEQLENILSRIQQEESFAQHVYQEISGNAMTNNKDYYSLQRSAEGFCGDFLFDARSPTGIRYVFLADAMGHGLAAALSMMPVINVVKAMAHRSMPISSIMHEVNRRLNIELPDDRFVALAGIEVSPFSQKISVVNAGLPAIFVADKAGNIEECESKSLPLGIIQGNSFTVKPDVFDLTNIASLFMYTDGLIEQENQDGEVISKQGLRRALIDLAASKQSWEAIANMFTQHTGENPLSDDVSLCAIDFDKLELEVQTQGQGEQRKGSISCQLDIRGDYLNTVDGPAFVSKFLYAAGLEGKLAGKTFTAVAELYQNGLDHGVLELDSALKNDADGFLEYVTQRESALDKLKETDRVTLTLDYSAEGGLEATVSDSGQGYDTKTIAPDQYSLFGRGLALVRQLSESCTTNSIGNNVKVVIRE